MEEISIETASQLLDFSGNPSEPNAAWGEYQLEGAVALHNILVREKFAYLADEVGMGKTYVALGVTALFRHFQPGWRVLYIVPRSNLQHKWEKEQHNFVANNWRVTDNRVRSFQGTPAYGLALCDRLRDLAHEVTVNPNRDFLLRMTSFSLGLGDDRTKAREALLDTIPWLDPSLFDLRGDKEPFKDNYARAINCILPHFDLVVIDEGHNLKHGLQPGAATRNRLIAYLLGHPEGQDRQHFPNYGPRADRVLVLSATPLDNDYRDLWNQVYLLTGENRWPELADPTYNDEQTQTARTFLIRRLTELTIGGKPHTKNMYRREWRNGGVTTWNDPLKVDDKDDKRPSLIVALVQKKVAEVLGRAQFNPSFQIGMLASFESFLETARRVLPAEFEESDQAVDLLEKEGIDTPSINKLSSSYRRNFGTSLPHPKLDILAENLAASFVTREKALVFVRRLRSVDDLRDKLEERYDTWIRRYMSDNLPERMRSELEAVFVDYGAEREQQSKRRTVVMQADLEESGAVAPTVSDESNEGGNSNFFAWFFRGEGPQKWFSGAAFDNKRLSSEGSVYSIFFEDNYLTYLLGESSDPVVTIAQQVDLTRGETARKLRALAFGYLTASQESRQEKHARPQKPVVGIGSAEARLKKYQRRPLFRAYQAAGLRLLSDRARDTTLAERAQTIYRDQFEAMPIHETTPHGKFQQPDDYVGAQTFFTELAKRPELQAELWPVESDGDSSRQFRRREQRRELLSAAARLGHPFIDLWLVAALQMGTLQARKQQRLEGGATTLIRNYLDRLDKQHRERPLEYTAFRELAEIAHHFDLILAVNFHDINAKRLVELPTYFAQALGGQTPVGGISGGVQGIKRITGQFRMPGYPMILITTDILREGDDLHTFCAKVIHYGITWTPSSMEQRTGRVDRIHSLTQRSLDGRSEIQDEEKLQVYYPHLLETYERLQVLRVYERMNRFTRMIHRSLGTVTEADSCIHTLRDFVDGPKDIEPIEGRLDSPFKDVEEWLHRGQAIVSTGAAEAAEAARIHFQRMCETLETVYRVKPERRYDVASYFATVFIMADGQLAVQGGVHAGERRQPLALFLRSAPDGCLLLRCVSPIGVVPQDNEEAIQRIWSEHQQFGSGKICAVRNAKLHTYDLTSESDILFHPDTTEQPEVVDLIERTGRFADRMERALLSKDEPMAAFREDLVKEPKRA